MSKFGLMEVDIEKIKQVFQTHPAVEKVMLYGSRAKGNYTVGSDIDITIMPDLSWEEFNRIESELEELFLPYQFDVSIFSHINNQQLIEHIIRAGQVIYNK